MELRSTSLYPGLATVRGMIQGAIRAALGNCFIIALPGGATAANGQIAVDTSKT